MDAYDFQEVFEEIRELLTIVHGTLIDAIDNANQIQSARTELLADPILWAQNVRAYLAKNLGVEIDPDDFSLERGFNLSLTVHGRSVAIRILKAQIDKLPQAGNSPGRLIFFNQNTSASQQDSLEFDAEPEQIPCKPSNFLIVWGVQGGKLAYYLLAYPKASIVNGEYATQEWYWARSILEETKPKFVIASEAPEEVLDLDIKRADEADVEGEEEKPEDETGTDPS
jgi:hypothetical protein